jgi:signal transduction histidine kinase
MEYLFGREGVILSTRTDPVWTVHDPDAVEQTVLNLLSNALKYGGGKPVSLDCGAVNGDVQIAVRDCGDGIDPAARERIFERFHREAEAIRRNIPGAGLGLALVRHIAEAHGGDVSVESTPGEGSTFTVSIPIRES